MKKLFIRLGMVLLLAASGLAQTAQNTLVNTTLGAAITTTTSTLVVVASATGITAPASGATSTIIYVDKEAMFVNAVNGTTLTVMRGYSGTAATPHVNGSRILAGRPTWFANVDPAGGCTNANVIATPLVNINNGNQWLCSTVTGMWVPGFGNYDKPLGVTTAVASVAGTTTPSGPLFHITGTNTITAWGIPPGCNAATGAGACVFIVIPDAAFLTTATNNIATAVTAVANLAQIWTWDATNSKFVVLQSK